MSAAPDWASHARALADRVSHRGSRWYEPIARTPRHAFVPAWWEREDDEWVLRRGPLARTYTDRSLVTRVGPLHADHADPAAHPGGRPTSSSTQPSLALRMYRYAQLADGLDVLEVGTGSGYGTALLCHRHTKGRITTVDVDPYLTKAGAGRFDALGLHPKVHTLDATGPLPGAYHRIVSTVAVRPIPAAWLEALPLGGRLVTTITGTWMILTATKTKDGFFGQVERDWAGFMNTRSGDDYDPDDGPSFDAIRGLEGEQVRLGSYPLVDVAEAPELSTLLGIAAPGIRHYYQRDEDGLATALMTHPDGSWARAEAVGPNLPVVQQGGPRRLWDELDRVRTDWLATGHTPWLGASAMILEDGTVKLRRGDWRATIS